MSLKDKSFEAFYFDILKEISQYSNTEVLRKRCRTMYGLEYCDALEMAYENAIETAKIAVKGKKRPRETTK